MHKIHEFWKNEGDKHIIPNTGSKFPEGFKVSEVLKRLTKDESVLEVGCGYGRLASNWAPDKYIGIDINHDLIKKAKETHPEHRFLSGNEYFMENGQWEGFESILVYTVLLHVSDEDIDRFVGALVKQTDKNVLVAEIMGQDWRRPGNPPVFNREYQEYVDIFERQGMNLSTHEKHPYKRYDGWNKKDTNIHFLKFEKNE